MTALVFTSLAQAQALQAQVDAALGMPLDPSWTPVATGPTGQVATP